MPTTITLPMMRAELYSAVVSDALDSLGLPHQSPRLQLPNWTGQGLLVGRCKTTLWVDMSHVDPRPYELELQAVDACQPDDVLIAAAGGSIRSGIWGELLTTAAKNAGCVGAIIDGAIRDVTKIAPMNFPVFARATCVYDSLNRQRVVDADHLTFVLAAQSRTPFPGQHQFLTYAEFTRIPAPASICSLGAAAVVARRRR